MDKKKLARRMHELWLQEKRVAETLEQITARFGKATRQGPSICAVALFAAAFNIIDTEIMSTREDPSDEEFNETIDRYLEEAGIVYREYMFEEKLPTVDDVAAYLEGDDPQSDGRLN